MFKKLKIISYSLIIIISISLLSSCYYVIRDTSTPQESFVPQTIETIDLIKPDNQNDSVKPFFYGIESEENPIRPLETAETIRGQRVGTYIVNNETELIETAMKGWRPVFYQGSSLRVLYNKVLMVLNTIILNDMTEYERVLAIYDYLAYYTIYDFELLAQYVNDSTSVSNTDPAFCLSGVFNDGIAVCDGFSKAFSLMCSIEGIENVIITGLAGNDPNNRLNHAWNKVKIDGNWYGIDSTNASFAITEDDEVTEYLTHAYFLISDNELRQANFVETKIESAFNKLTLNNVNADNNYGFYQKEYIKDYYIFNIRTLHYDIPHNYVFETKIVLRDYLDYAKNNLEKDAAEFYSDIENIASVLELNERCNKIYDNVYYILF